MQWRTWSLITMIGVMLLAACGAPAMPEKVAEPDTSMATPAMTDTMAMTDTAMTTATHAMTDTMAMSDTAIPTETHAMTDGVMMTGTHAMTDSAMTDGAMMPQDLPAWQTMPLTNVRTGETFTLADFAGKPVFVETMATWCPNCRQQLGNVKSAAERVSGDQAVFVAISVETDLTSETLAQYADDNSFGWTFAVATPDLVQALADTFGQTIANPPATPHFVIQPDGMHGELVTGFESGDEILANLGF